MRFAILSCIKYSLKDQHTKKYFFSRHASTGLGFWHSEITTEIKHEIEKYWKDKIHIVNDTNSVDGKDKFYVLSMFPYPSGSLHMGHVRVYTISDSVARFYRMQGKNVIHPMGWDAFGLPAENAAIEHNVDPAEWTKTNIQKMRNQLKILGCTFDTHRELSTCDPDYYKWTQELFLKLYENGLLYQKNTFVNWDPVDQTVLADEQVDENNKSWRSGAIVEKRLLKQWFVKTTVFAKSLIEGLQDKTLRNWRDVLKIQEHWIGHCTGTNFDFKLISDIAEYPTALTLWTDKPEFIENAKFIAISENNLLTKIEKNETQNGIWKLKAHAINPFTNEQLPIFVTDREILPYSHGRDDYVGIPCLSETDAAFCEMNGINYEAGPVYSIEELELKRLEILQIARERNIGGYLVSSRLRDWLISRQRYWGTPIPIINCENCGCQPVPRDQLPVTLPPLDKLPDMKNRTLKNAGDWLKTSCPKCNGPATRETDTMDTFMDSSWYFMRYIDPQNVNEMFSKEKAFSYLPVDLYIGGKEHAALHLYYARFISHFLHHLGLVPTKEPFKQLLVQGMVMGQTYCNKDGKYLKISEVENTKNGFIEKETKQPVAVEWMKMSKSKHNGVEPVSLISEYSTDTIRLLILADVTPTSHRNWSTETFPGILNWQQRLWHLVKNFIQIRTNLDESMLKQLPVNDDFERDEELMFDSRNYYLVGVTFNIMDSQQLSIAISKMQGLTNGITKAKAECIARGREYERVLACQIIMLAPLAPHFASELWAGFCSAPHRIVNDGEIQWDKDVLEQRWPEVDFEYKVKVNIKVNGKKVTTVRISSGQLETMTAENVLQLVMNEDNLQRYFTNRTVVKFTFKRHTSAGAYLSIKTKKVDAQNDLKENINIS